MISSKKTITILFLTATMFFFSCGKSNTRQELIIEGNIYSSVDLNNSNSPVFVAVADTEDFDKIGENPSAHIIALIAVNKKQGRYTIDLSDKGINTDSVISLFAFMDNNIKTGLPNPDAGDILGFYLDPSTMSTGIKLKKGINTGFDITIDRKVYDFHSSVSGHINNSYSGSIILLAFKGEIESLDFSNINSKGIIAYRKLTKADAPLEYSLNIIPYGYDLPIRDVFIIALFDSNGNGVQDGGEQIGFYSETNSNAPNMPSLINIVEGDLTGCDINEAITLPEPSGDAIEIHGTIHLSSIADLNSPPLFVMVAQTKTPEDLIQSPAQCIKYFKRYPADTTEFSIDLSGSGLAINDEVLIAILWDKDYKKGFPSMSPGDMIGYHIDEEAMSVTIALDETNHVDISVDKEIFDYNQQISGRISNSYMGDVLTFAYKGEFSSLDFTQFNFRNIIGYSQFPKSTEHIDFIINILPYGNPLPITDVYIMALFDKNANGKPDPGEEIGFFSENTDNTPSMIELSGGIVPETNINSGLTIPIPSGDSILVQGTLTFEAPVDDNSPPVFIVVSQADSIDEIVSSPSETVKYFKKFPATASGFSIDLSRTGLSKEDSVIITALWDNDYTGGFPSITPGDKIGYYINNEAMTPFYRLDNTSVIDLSPGKTVYNYTQTCSGMISGNYSGEIQIVAYKGDFTTLSFKSLDFKKIIGYTRFNKIDFSVDYQINILPFGYDLPIEDVYIFALFDSNGNGKPDSGESIGFYSTHPQGFPSLINLKGNNYRNLDINAKNSFKIPASSNDSISISGFFNQPEDYQTSQMPVFIIIAETDNPSSLFSNPLSVIRAFSKLSSGTNNFHIDLSETTLEEGDRIMITALWDKDFKQNPDSYEYTGFPSPTVGDYSGYYQNKETFQTSITLESGNNIIEPHENWYFNVNRKIFNTVDDEGVPTSIKFRLQNGGGISLKENDELIMTAIHKNGMSGSGLNMHINDIDYVVSMKSIIFNGNLETPISIDVFPAQIESIITSSFDINNVYIFAILDQNKNGLPDPGEKIGFYYDWFFVYLPKLRNLTPGINDISDSPGSTLNKTVIFTNYSF
jgi:hypothetical protein